MKNGAGGIGGGARRRDYRVAFRETPGRRLSQHGRNYRRGRKISREISQDAHPGRSVVSREVLFHAGRPWFSGVGNKAWQDRCLRLLGPMVSRSGPADGIAGRRNYFLSDSDRLASEREKRIWRGATFGLGNNSAKSRDRERLLRGGSESCRSRRTGRRRRD